MRKFLIYLNSFLILILGFFNWPGNKEYIQHYFPHVVLLAEMIVIVGGVLVNLMASLIPNWNESKLLLAYQRSSTFNAAAEAFMEKYIKYKLSINVMVVTGKYCSKMEANNLDFIRRYLRSYGSLVIRLAIKFV